MKIFLATNWEGEHFPCITLESAYKNLEGSKEYVENNFLSLEEVQKLYKQSKNKNMNFRVHFFDSEEIYNMYIEELTVEH